LQLARVIGTLVATQKHPNFEGSKLLLVQPVTPGDVPQGPLLLAVDSVGAGVHERVLIVLDGKAAVEAMQRKGTPVDAAIVGIVDQVDLHEEARGA
jgi:ethanolamine utilization protein EutN